MKRLLKDAQKLTGQKYDISNFADVVNAIQAIQEEMGIAGTTSKEAATTIQGSALAMKAAWSNFITGMADENADFDQLLGNLTESVLTFLENLIPRIKKMLPRLIRGLTEIGKSIGKHLPGILKDLVPELAKGVRELLISAVGVAKELIPIFKDMGLDLVKSIYEGLKGKEMSGEMFETLKEKVDQAFEAVRKITEALVEFGRKIMESVGPALVWIGDMALKAFVWIGDNINWLLPVLSSLLGAMLAFRAVKKVSGIVSGFMSIFKLGSKGGKGLAGGAGGLMGDSSGTGSSGGLFSGLANMKPTTILKGMTNLTIIVGGLMLLGAAVAKAAPYIAQLSDGQSLMEVLAICSTVGLVGSGMAKLAGMIGNIPVSTVAKGLANIAIVVAGLGALAAVLAWVAPYINDLGSMEDTAKLLLVIGAVGLIGSAMAGLAGLIGAIPVAVVATGLANIAVVLGGLAAVIAAFGALSLIPGYFEFMESGGEALSQICGILGEMAGSIIGGIGEGITNGLPGIGENISAFATAIEPAITAFSGMDYTGLQSFADAFGAFVLAMTGEAILSWFTGGIDYGKIGTDLTALTTNGAGFFEAVQAIPEAAFTNATKLFETLNGIGLLPNSGGVAQWFTGSVDYAGIATGLTELAGTTEFFTAVQAIPEAAFANATKLFETLSGIGLLPNTGGVAQWFTGSVDFASIVSGIRQLASPGMIMALLAISAIPETAYSGLNGMFEALAGIKDVPEEGGIFGWFTGDNSTGLKNIAAELPEVATNIAKFFTNIGDRTDFSPIKNLFATLGGIELNTNVADKGFWNGVSQLGSMGTGLADFANNGASFFTLIDTIDTEKLKSFFAEMGGASGLPDSLTGLDGTIGTILSTMQNNIDTSLTTIKTNVTTWITDFVAVVTAGMMTVQVTADTGLAAIVETITGYTQPFYNAGADIMAGLDDGMWSMRDDLLYTARSIASEIAETINSAMDINSPSKVTTWSGQMMGAGVKVGLLDSVPDVKLAAREVSDAAMIPYDPYGPESGATYNSSSTSNENMTISPTFNLTISGTSDDRSMARKVKQYVSEAIAETFDSMERKGRVLREA